jgi:N-acetylmuramoyl-L-alanine amidase
MATCPFATQKPVTSHGGPIEHYLGVVIHVTAGEGDPYNEFANPANQVSSHFGIGNGQGGMPDGEIEQYVDTANQSWAQVAGNAEYISIETEGEPSDPLTAFQVAAFAKLYRWLADTHAVPYVLTDEPGQRGFITHGDGGAAWGGHLGCPGDLRKAQRAAILAAATAGSTKPRGGKESDMALIVTNSAGTGFVVATDLTSKVGLVENTVAVLQATGQYAIVPKGDLPDEFIAAIPLRENA